MKAILIGYFPKHTAIRPKGIRAPDVVEICSVSFCISETAEGMVDLWKHNNYFMYDSPEQVLCVLKILHKRITKYDIYAYKLYPIIVKNGTVAPKDVVLGSEVVVLSDHYEFLGYDAVNREDPNGEFGHSPLSCNKAAETMRTNKYCLFTSLDEAMSGAKLFSMGRAEPGPYYIVEVYRFKKKRIKQR